MKIEFQCLPNRSRYGRFCEGDAVVCLTGGNGHVVGITDIEEGRVPVMLDRNSGVWGKYYIDDVDFRPLATEISPKGADEFFKKEFPYNND